MSNSPMGTSRRTVAKGMAWTVPVVMAAAPARASVASGFCVGTLCFGGIEVHKCCPPRDPNFYWVEVTFTNNAAIGVDVTFSFTLTPSASGPVSFSGGGPVGAGLTETFLVRGSTTPGNCSNATYPGFNIAFSDGVNSGSTPVPGGSTGGNFCTGAPAALAARQSADVATAPEETLEPTSTSTPDETSQGQETTATPESTDAPVSPPDDSDSSVPAGDPTEGAPADPQQTTGG